MSQADDDAYVARFMPPGMNPSSPFYGAQRDAILARRSYEADPSNQAAVQQQSAENNAYRSAQTASMGMMTTGPNSTVVSDPSTAFQKFVQSGYTPQQALADGWATSGNGNRGWENMVGYQAPLNPQGMIGAPYAQQQIQQYQAQQQQPQYGQQAGAGMGNPFGTPPRNGPAQQAYGQASPRGNGIYQQLGSMLGGGQQNPFARPVASAQAPGAPAMPMSSGVPAGGYGQRQNMLGQSPAWQSFLSNLKPGGM